MPRLHEKGLSQDRFAEVCSIDRTHMGKIERGEVNVTVATTLKLVRGLELSLSDFFSELDKELDDKGVTDPEAAPS